MTYPEPQRAVTGVVVPAASTATATELVNLPGGPLVVVVKITAFTSGTLTVAINGMSPSGYTWNILTSAALAAAATTPLKIGRALTPAANTVVNDVVPSQIQVVATVSGGGVLTYGIDYCAGE